MAVAVHVADHLVPSVPVKIVVAVAANYGCDSVAAVAAARVAEGGGLSSLRIGKNSNSVGGPLGEAEEDKRIAKFGTPQAGLVL